VVENARQQWEDGFRRLQALRPGDPDLYHGLLDRVHVVADELRRRVGSHFTLAELAAAYRDADRWTSEAVAEQPQASRFAGHATLVEDAAFHFYARGAIDYEP
jgi:hypothetical protein